MMSTYFTPVYPWQAQAWHKLTASYPDCAHALLLAGSKGTGKLEFARRFAAWVLCQNKPAAHACGSCSSCEWLKSNTHPQLLHVTVTEDSKSQTIKVDDIRAILPFAQQSSAGARVVLIQDAELMNTSAANALLKTLEEPAGQVLFLLTSSHPQSLLPTIKSRTQQPQVSHVEKAVALDFLAQQGLAHADTLLAVAGGAPLAAQQLVGESWYKSRSAWLKVWQALRAGQRDHLAASSYWQNQLDLAAALELNALMCRDVLAYIQDMSTLQNDVDFGVLEPAPSARAMVALQHFGNVLTTERKQNISTSFAFDELMLMLADC